MDLVKRPAFGWPSSSAGGRANPTKGLVIHYDGSNQRLASKPHSACVSYWKNTRRFHMRTRGWADIGYSFGACPHGYVFEGRGLGRTQAAQPGGNTTYYSCTLMSGPAEMPTPEQINAVRSLRSWLMGKGLAGTVKGHRDFKSTACPGDLAYRMVKDGTFKGSSVSNWMEKIVNKLPTLKRGDTGEHVETLQGLLLARSHPEVKMTGSFDAVTEAAVKAVQKWGGTDDDGIVGPKSWPVLLRVHK